MAAMANLLQNNIDITPMAVINIFRARTRPRMEYGLAFYATNNTITDALDVLQNKFMRISAWHSGLPEVHQLTYCASVVFWSHFASVCCSSFYALCMPNGFTRCINSAMCCADKWNKYKTPKITQPSTLISIPLSKCIILLCTIKKKSNLKCLFSCFSRKIFG